MPESIDRHAHFGRLGVVVSTVGYGRLGMVEELADAQVATLTAPAAAR
ncbi:hypothetical protein O1Q96_22800 [Streptomyces sp. Qhu-G9]|nr:hypothetical protein [Streptomyces aurantiacus]WAU82337.1 hypothetical protein O1Q96_22800 [Streptomyces aurantiacus]